jgi:hypothetical protein
LLEEGQGSSRSVGSMTIVMRMMMNDQSLIAFMIAVFSLKCNSKLKVKVKFTLEQASKAQRGIRCIALFFL